MHTFSRTKAVHPSATVEPLLFVQSSCTWNDSDPELGGGLKTAFSLIHHLPAAREASQLFLFHPALLFVCQAEKNPKKTQHLFPHVLHKDSLWFLICSTLLLLSVPALISLQPTGPARHCPGKLFSTPASIGQSWSSLVCWWGRVEASLLWKLSQGHGIIFIQAVLFLANTHLPQQRKKHICVHISASGRLRVSAHWIRL